uniref:uncharacterized protein isoform X2 n=1 Tax=Myxine glutinosa TaxID=7769 RepID=UPI00358F84C4
MWAESSMMASAEDSPSLPYSFDAVRCLISGDLLDNAHDLGSTFPHMLETQLNDGVEKLEYDLPAMSTPENILPEEIKSSSEGCSETEQDKNMRERIKAFFVNLEITPTTMLDQERQKMDVSMVQQIQKLRAQDEQPYGLRCALLVRHALRDPSTQPFLKRSRISCTWAGTMECSGSSNSVPGISDDFMDILVQNLN